MPTPAFRTAAVRLMGTPPPGGWAWHTFWVHPLRSVRLLLDHLRSSRDCPLGMAACSASNYGMVVKKLSTRMSVDTRIRIAALAHGRCYMMSEPP
jgi:hypothetical protein